MSFFQRGWIGETCRKCRTVFQKVVSMAKNVIGIIVVFYFRLKPHHLRCWLFGGHSFYVCQ